MKLLSWNVNGFRAVMNKGFTDFLDSEDPDVVCLQEIKAQELHLPLGYEQYKITINVAEKKGYSGVAILSKTKPLSITKGLGFKEHDNEGRVITAEFEKFFLVTVYTPNSKRGLLRLDYRQEWDKVFLKHLKELEKNKPVVVCGDLNVAHKEIDLTNPGPNKRNAGFTEEERAGFQTYLDNGFIDTFREFDQSEGKYTWWSYMHNARARNIGWRLDYFLVSESIKKNIKDAFILDQIMGSDHCPVGIEFK